MTKKKLCKFDLVQIKIIFINLQLSVSNQSNVVNSFYIAEISINSLSIHFIAVVDGSRT